VQKDKNRKKINKLIKMVEKADVGGSEHEKSVVSAGALWSWFITGIPS